VIQSKEIDILGLGVSTIYFLNVVNHFPDKEEVQKSLNCKLEGGGPVATAIVTLARLGAKTAMLDSIGDDWIGNKIIEDLKKEKVITDYIKINKGFTSSTASILVRENDGARTIVYSPGNSSELTEDDVPTELITKSKFLHLNGRHFSACAKACEIAKECNTQISFDGGSHRYRQRLKKIVPLTNVCIVSKEFSERYTDEKAIDKAGKILLSSGPEIVVITDGINGSWLFIKEINCYHQKAFIMEKVVDTTGCGDSFHGAFLFGLCNGYDLFKTIHFASAVAALNTQHLGGRSGLPVLKEVLEFIEKNKT
jgi:sugar/nucleoside kinase (ribokinase family)